MRKWLSVALLHAGGLGDAVKAECGEERGMVTHSSGEKLEYNF